MTTEPSPEDQAEAAFAAACNNVSEYLMQKHSVLVTFRMRTNGVAIHASGKELAVTLGAHQADGHTGFTILVGDPK